MGVKKVRASSLNMAINCPGYPSLSRNTKRSDEQVKTLGAGTQCHKYLEWYMGERDGLKVPPPSTSPEVNSALADFLPWWEQYSKDNSPIEKVESTSLECAYKLKFRGLHITGHPDVVMIGGGIAWVIDWKYGGGQKFIQTPISEDLQLLTYALFTGCTRVAIERVRVSDCETDRLELDEQALNLGAELIEDTARNVKRGDYRPGIHCGYCLARTKCKIYMRNANSFPAALMTKPETAMLKRGEALKWALNKSAIDAAVKLMNKKLVEYVEAYGPLVHEGRELGLSEYMKDTIDNTALLGYMKENCNVDDIMQHASMSKAGAKAVFGKGFDKHWQHCKTNKIVGEVPIKTTRWRKVKP